MVIQSDHWAIFYIVLCILMECASGDVTKDGYVESCPHLLYVRKGKLLNYGRELGTVVTVQCNEGYVFHGNPSLKCERHQKHNTMVWNTTLNSFGCEKDLMYCPHQHVSNGHCSLKDRSIHSIRTCECNQGYTLEGHSKSSCQSDKTWSHSAPKCQVLTVRICSQNGIIKDGQCTYSSFNGNNRLERTCNCNTGFELMGASQATCGPDADWSSTLPTCIKSCPRLLNPQFGYLSNYTAIYNQSVTYYCRKGYYVDTRNGANTRRCLDTGHWSGRAPSCQRKTCPLLQPPRFGNVSNIAATYNQSVTYYCDKGYRLITRHGVNTRRCLDTGQWSGRAPFCQHVCADSSLKCRSTETCAVDSNGKAHCQCMDVSGCPSELRTVCGSDGQTYNNKCIMKLRSCQEGKHNTTVVAEGSCHFGGVCSADRPKPKQGKSCRAYLYRYWYNSTSRKCERYVYGGCYEGKNSFYTIEDCEQTCIKDDVCKLDFDGGKCNFLNEAKWFFNKTSQLCESFQYGGCFGNENHFSFKDLCQAKCLKTKLKATERPTTDQQITNSSCVCNSRVNRSEAMTQFDAVCKIRITSVKKEVKSSSNMQHNAKFNETCVISKERNRTANAESKLTISFKERTQNGGTCVCPVFVKDKIYRVGLKKTTLTNNGRVQYRVPRDYFVEAV